MKGKKSIGDPVVDRKRFSFCRRPVISAIPVCLLLLAYFLAGPVSARAAGISEVNRLGVTEAGGNSYNLTLARIDAVPPWEIENLQVQAPDGSSDNWCCFEHWHWTVYYSYQDGTSYALPDNFLHSSDGTYTLSLSDFAGTTYPQVTTDFSANQLPVVDITTATPADRAYVNTLTPTLSWNPVVDETVTTPYYQVQIFQYDENRSPFYVSPLISATTWTIPTTDPATGRSVLEDVHRYRWRVLVYDGSTPQASSNLAISDFSDFYVELIDNPPALAYCRAQSRVKDERAPVTRFIGGLVNTLPDEVMVQLKDPASTVIHTFDMSRVDNSGWFYWTPDNTDSPAGTYTFEVLDPQNSNVLSSCTTQYQPNWTLAPVDSIFAPDDKALVPTETPTFSWMEVAGATRYRILIMDYDWKTLVYLSPIAQETTVTIPAGYLKKNSAYRVRVSAYDGNESERGNRSDSGWNSFFVTDDAAAAHLSGTVSAGSSGYVDGEPIIVAAFRSHSLADADLLGWTTLNGLGQYTLYNMPMNTDIYIYALWDHDDNGVPTPDEWQGWHSATALQLSSSGVTNDINISFSDQVAAASISGTISVDHFETGHGPIYIGVFSGPDTHGDPLLVSTLTEPGPYTVTGLAAGWEYSVGVHWDVDDSGLNNLDTPGDADADYANNPIMTVAGDNPGIDVALEVGGVISGTITDGTAPIAGVHVYFVDTATNQFMNGTNTDQNGVYSCELPPGTYQVNACPQCPNPPLPYVNQSVDNVSVAALENVQQDFILSSGAIIQGTVLDSEGTPVSGVPIMFNSGNANIWIPDATTDDSGFYQQRVPAGTYTVEAHPSWTGLPYLDAFSAPVTVDDNDVQSVDFQLVNGVNIQGVVSYDGAGVADVRVSFYNSTTDQWFSEIQTEQDGSYLSPPLTAGDYTLYFYPPCSTGLQAEQRTITVADQTTTLDLVLQPGGTVQGTITDPAGDPVANVHVDIFDPDISGDNWVNGTNTDAGGNYCMVVRFDHTYDVNACPQCNGQQYLDQTTTIDPLTTETPTVQVDFQLDTGGYIAGTVTANGSGVGNVRVSFFDPDTNQWYWDVFTQPDGSYQSPMLPEATYDVGFEPPCDTGLLATTMTGAATVVKDQTVPLDYAPGSGGIIQGLVTDTQNTPLEWIHVYITDSDITNGNNWAGGTNTGQDGRYCLVLPLDHNYDVNACPNCSHDPYLDQSQSAGMLDSSTTPVTVDFALQPGGWICGTVTDSANSPLAGVEVEFIDPVSLQGFGISFTDNQGQYCSQALAEADYEVRAYPNRSGMQYVDQTYPTTVTVSAGQTRGNIDFALAGGGTICGQVIDQVNTTGIAYLWVSFQDSITHNDTGGIDTDPNGNYCYTLPLGSYLVRACPSCSGLGYVDEGYPGTVTLVDATPVGINPIALEYPDGDGMDDQWELQYFDSLGVLTDNGDYDQDGFTDLQEYQNQQAGLTDADGNPFDPTVANAQGQNPGFLPAVYQLLLTR